MITSEMRTLASQVIYELPKASLKELICEAMKSNRGAMHPGYMLDAIKSALRLEKESLRETVSKMCVGCDPRMETSFNALIMSLENKVRDIDHQLYGTDSAPSQTDFAKELTKEKVS